MINKKIAVLGLAVLSLGLVACDNGGETESTGDDDFVQKTEELENEHNWQLVGQLTNPCEGYEASMNWNPSAANPLHFKEVEGSNPKTYILENVHLEVGDEFKFATNDKWGGDLPYSALDPKSSAYANFETTNADDPGAGNIKTKVAGDYNFYYRYWYAMDTANYGAAFQVELAK